MGLLVGRASELEQLETALRRAQSGVGATVLVAGDAGIGKTRLLGELMERAHAAGAHVLSGRGIDLIGAELPFLPLVDALRPLGEALPALGDDELSRLRWFEDLLELLTRLSRSAPVLLVLDDVHWADHSTLDAVAFLAHHVADRRIVLVAAYRPEIERLPAGLIRAATVVELGPLATDELAAALAALRPERSAAALMDIAERSEGNPFFAEELLAASVSDATLPPVLRTVLLQRIAQLDRRCQDVLRIAAAAGRDVPYRLLEAVVELDEPELQAALRRAVEHGVLIADQASARFRFRHALLADAVYGTLVPGERERLHRRLGEALADADAPAAELAHHWAVAGRAPEALAASVQAAREAKAVAGFAEALRHAERVVALWDRVPDAAQRAGMDLASALDEAAALALLAGDARRAVELSDRELAALDGEDPVRAALVHHRRSRYLWSAMRHEEGLAAQERAVELVPAEPSAARATVLAGLAHILMLRWRHEDSLRAAEEAVAMARAVVERRAEIRALGVLGTDLAYLGDGDRGIACLREALALAEEPEDVYRCYALLSDGLTMLGRFREGADAALEGRDQTARLGIERGLSAVLAANASEALFVLGEWDAAAAVAERALRRGVEVQRYAVLDALAAVEIARGELDSAAARLDEAAGPAGGDSRSALQHLALVAELALVRGDPAAAREQLDWALARAAAPDAALRRAELCALALRADADQAALDRRADEPRRHADAVLADARSAADAAAAVTPLAAGWHALAEAEYTRLAGPAPDAAPDAWRAAAATWDRLAVPYRAAYCRRRQAEALVAAGASRLAAAVPAREAHAAAVRLGAAPLRRELELLAERARLDLSPPAVATAPPDDLGLTPREREVLDLIARGLTNREIAGELVISTKTAAIHVSNILHKLGVPTRIEAAAIAQRLSGRH